MRKVVAAIIALFLLALLCVSCKDTPEAPSGYYKETQSLVAPTSAAKVELAGYSFVSFLDGGLVKVERKESDVTLYGVIDVASGDLLFDVRYTDIAVSGDFFLLTPASGSEKCSIAYRDGTILRETDEAPSAIHDIGDGRVSVTERAHSYVLEKSGNEPMRSSFLPVDCIFSSCGNYILAFDNASGTYFVFDARTGQSVLVLSTPASSAMYVYYVGGDEFITITDTDVDSLDDYTIALTLTEDITYFIKQTVRSYTIGTKVPRTIETGEYIHELATPYALNYSRAEREAYPLREGYFALASYVRDADKHSDGQLRFAVTDRTLLPLTDRLPEGISPLRTAVDGRVVSGVESNTIYVFDEELRTLRAFTDAHYESVGYNDGVIVATKQLESGQFRYGAMDLEGNLIAEFKYTYMSRFMSGKAVAVRGGQAYLIDKSGNETYLSDERYPAHWDGYYAVMTDGRISLVSYAGDALTLSAYQSIRDVKREGSTLYVALDVGEGVTEVYR